MRKLIEGKFYWIRQDRFGRWEPAQCGKGHWWVTGYSRPAKNVYEVGRMLRSPK